MSYLDTIEIAEAQEGQQVEFKEASFELPDDLWETYSAFANTEGGEIILGISEDRESHQFSITGVLDPQKLIDSFWNTVRDPQKVSRDVMLRDGVYTIEKEGKTLVVITVPRAERIDKPVKIYSKKTKWTSWIRRGSGDYKTTEQDISLMLYDGTPGADRRVLERFDNSSFCPSSVKHYRNLFAAQRPQHPWNSESDEDFLYHVGALAKGSDGNLYATQAGLLAFGYEYEITNHFAHYLLDYREETSGKTRWDDRIVSQSGDWSGNLIDFYFAVTEKLLRYFKTPFTTDKTGTKHLSTNEKAEALNEVIANALIHAYYGSTGSIRIIVKPAELEVSNPGSFLVDKQVAIAGGFSEARNPALMKIFSLIGVSDRAGSGIQKVWETWIQTYGVTPSYEEDHSPATVRLHLPIIERSQERRGTSKTKTNKVARKKVDVEMHKLLQLLAEGDKVAAQDVAECLGVSERVAQYKLKALYEEGLLTREKNGKKYVYFLASK